MTSIVHANAPDTLALEVLYDACIADPTLDGVLQPFGWREPHRQLGQPSRIVWIPGDESSNLGKIVNPRYPGPGFDGGSDDTRPRPIANIQELFSCVISGSGVPKEDERAQYVATRLLLDTWIAAVYRAVHGNFTLNATKWITDKTERRYGAAVLVVGAILAVVPDTESPVAPADTHAHITATELDRIEVFDVPQP